MDKTMSLAHPLPALPQTKKQRIHHILLVEDSLVQAMRLKVVLEVEGLAVSVAGDGSEAIEQAQVRDFDLIVLDIELPTMNGYDTYRRLKASPVTTHIPVIFLTSRDHPLDAFTGLEMDIVDYIPKDVFAEATLVQTIRSLNKR